MWTFWQTIVKYQTFLITTSFFGKDQYVAALLCSVRREEIIIYEHTSHSSNMKKRDSYKYPPLEMNQPQTYRDQILSWVNERYALML